MIGTPEGTPFAVDGQEVHFYRLVSGDGLEVVITDLGAAVVSIFLPEENGKKDVLLGFSDLRQQMEKGPMFGATLGRCAGRIPGAAYRQKGGTFFLSRSHGADHAHGGIRGFDKRMFSLVARGDDRVVLRYISPDGEEGYPGNLTLDVTYSVLEPMTLRIDFRTECDRDTLCSVSNHMYFNLREEPGSADRHQVQLRAGAIQGITDGGMPTGVCVPVEGTSLDLRTPKRLSGCLAALAKESRSVGFDFDYLLDAPGEGTQAMIRDPESGRTVAMNTDLPCVHFYLADFGSMAFPGKNGARYSGPCGLCLEPMYASDSANNGLGPSPLLKAGEVRMRFAEYRFSYGRSEGRTDDDTCA